MNKIYIFVLRSPLRQQFLWNTYWSHTDPVIEKITQNKEVVS